MRHPSKLIWVLIAYALGARRLVVAERVSFALAVLAVAAMASARYL